MNCSDDSQRALIDQALQAARSGQPKRMAELLWRSGALAGLKLRLQARWPRLCSADIDDSIADSMESLFRAAIQNTPIGNLVGYLWRVASRRLFDRDRRLKREVPVEPSSIEVTGDSRAPIDNQDPGHVTPEIDQLALRRQALAHARALLPRLGQANVQAVMAYILEAVEAGREEVTNTEISTALGLSPETVRKSKQRGWKRLEREARKEGLAPDYDAGLREQMAVVDGESEDEDFEEE